MKFSYTHWSRSPRLIDDESSPGDVQFALEHVVSQAMAKYEADVAALRGES